MTVNICNMLYVKSVQAVADFWLTAGFVEISRQGEGQELTIVLAPSKESNARLQLWDIDFIRQVSPEVAESKPSLLFTVDNLEEWQAKIAQLTDTASEINNYQGMTNFNFADPEGNFYAFAANS